MTSIYVFDANSLISAHLLPYSVVFTRPKFDKYISIEDRLHTISLLELKSQLIEVTVPVIACRDPKDDKFLALALSIKADAIITGDQDLLVLHPFRDVDILSPKDFLIKYS